MSVFVNIFKVPNPNVVLLTVIVYFTFVGGFLSGIISGTIVILYSLYFFSVPSYIFSYSRENFQKVIVIVIFIPIMIIIVGTLKRRVEMKSKELEEANRKLELLSKMDYLTNIPNRGYFDLVLQNEYKLSVRMKIPLSLAMIDIDYFKKYNDEYGHLSGDECLKTVAQTIKVEVQRESDFLARYGGEEFVILFPNTNMDGAKTVCERIMKSIDSINIPHCTSPIGSKLTLSIGIASITDFEGYDHMDLLKKADEALYSAKEKGRNRLDCIKV
jgi:diguanylate cyclase (GGDEF)-like protein